MKLLAISTSSTVASAALLCDGAISSVRAEAKRGGHSEVTMPLVDELLSTAGTSVAEIDRFIADVGPGSFTGVRIGVCLINAMAFACDKQTVAISSLEALRFIAQNPDEGAICTLIDCRNGNGYAALYKNGEVIIPPSAVVVSELIDKLPDDVVIIGYGAHIHRIQISEKLPNARIHPNCEVNAELFIKCAEAGKGAVCGEHGAMPMYLRKAQAERMRDNA